MAQRRKATVRLLAPSNFTADVSSTTIRAGRTTLSDARADTRAPQYTPGTHPSRRAPVSPS